MAKVNPILAQYSSAVGHELHYTRFGRTYSRQLPAEYNDRKSESQLRQRALFKAQQAKSALMVPSCNTASPRKPMKTA